MEMQAFVFTAFGGPEHQQLTEVAQPTPGPSELLVEVHSAAVNPVDWKIREGLMRGDRDPAMPVVMGSELAGVVREVGQDVDGFAVGDEVFGPAAPGSGAFATYAVTSAAATAHKPTHLAWQDAATLSVAAATAYDGLEQLSLQSGQTLLINGIGGGVGVVAAQLGRDRGLAVFGTAGEDKRALVESLGAVLVPSGDGVAERVRELLPDGVHAVLDLVGGAALRTVAPLAARPGNVVSTADPTVTEVGGAYVQRDGTARPLDVLAALVVEGKLDPLVHEVMPLAAAAAALAAVEKGHARGKVVVQVR